MYNIVKLIELFSGYKTYIIGTTMIGVGIYLNDIQMILEGLGFITGRAAIAKIGKP